MASTNMFFLISSLIAPNTPPARSPEPLWGIEKRQSLMKKSIRISIVLSALLLSLVRSIPFWEKISGSLWNVGFYVAIFVLFVWILIKIIIEIIRLFRNRKNLQIGQIISITIMILVILDVTYNPFKIDLDRLNGKVVFTACYEGTQNQAIFKLRQNGKFDIHWTGVFFSNNYYSGDYVKISDTIYLKYRTEIPNQLGDTLIIKDNLLYAIKQDTITPTHFYLGNCKGLN